jgi:methylglutamate dehydrogenase subunit D
VLNRTLPLLGTVTKRVGGGTRGDGRLRLGEARGRGLLQVAAFPGSTTELEKALRTTLRTDLPSRVGQAISIGTRVLMRVGPEQFWIVMRDRADLPLDLGSVVGPTIGSVTQLSHSRSCIWIDGAGSREVLAAGLPVDLHPETFRLDFFALTGLHDTPILVHRSADRRYELYVLRTFAQWTWEWLVDAALPFGYEIADSN